MTWRSVYRDKTDRFVLLFIFAMQQQHSEDESSNWLRAYIEVSIIFI